jgi:phospholipid/cholesterol/gamma-HCH transport system substrate-binding protein/paraquat-inducible protein B
MSAKASYFKIGLFVIGAVVLGVIGTITLGVGSLFERTILLETYFAESVQGLSRGAQVSVQGVKIGEVENILLLRELYADQIPAASSGKYRGMVAIRFKIRPRSTGPASGDLKQALRSLVDSGFRMRLASQGITGVLHLQGIFVDPQENPPLELSWKPKGLYVPSVPSTVELLTESLTKISKNLSQTDFKKLITDVDMLVESVKGFVDEAKSRDLVGRVNGVLVQLEKGLEEIRGITGSAELKEGVKDLATNLPETLALLKRTIRKVDTILAARGSDIDRVFENLDVVTRDLRQFTSTLKGYPSQAIFGEPPPRRKTSDE